MGPSVKYNARIQRKRAGRKPEYRCFNQWNGVGIIYRRINDGQVRMLSCISFAGNVGGI